MSLTSELKEYAAERGVDLIGVTSSKALSHSEAYLRNARSVIVLGLHFNRRPLAPSPPGIPRGRVSPGLDSCLAMGDYCGEVIKKYLNEKGYSAVQNERWTGIALKPLAVKAGVGVYGKNSLIHAEGFGSWIELGCVITDAPLEWEERSHKLSDCGDCTACMEACPTGAIKDPYQVTPSLCITLWLEVAVIPREFREKVENRLVGCEICQQVCPKNEGLALQRNYPVEVEEKSNSPELIPLLLGDEDYYRAVLPDFALQLVSVSNMRRNVAVALGNIADPVAVPALIEALNHSESRVRPCAAWALGRIGGEEARRALAQSLNTRVNSELRREIEAALEECSKS